jgi:hypothetical protein
MKTRWMLVRMDDKPAPTSVEVEAMSPTNITVHGTYEPDSAMIMDLVKARLLTEKENRKAYDLMGRWNDGEDLDPEDEEFLQRVIQLGLDHMAKINRERLLSVLCSQGEADS